MEKYNEYIHALKQAESGVNYDQMFSKINYKIKRKAFNSRLIFAGAFALLIISFFAYFNPWLKGEGALMTYVIDKEEVNGSPLMAYVFGD